MLRASFVRRRPGFLLDVELAAEPGHPLVLVGESGAGKTTVLRLLAGLEPPDTGRMELDGVICFDGVAGTTVPAWRRPIGYVPQDVALFPHLTVFDNVAFGLRASGRPEREVRALTAAMLARLSLDTFASRRPRELSGGQQQRVALGRALALEPRLLLLDEPLAALDLQARRDMRIELQRLLREVSCISLLVTHSPMEALILGEQIAVIEAGRITQRGRRDDLLRQPRSPYVAAFLGLNLFCGRITDRAAGQVRVHTPEAVLAIDDPGGDADVFIAVEPRDITVHLDKPFGSAQNVFRGPVLEIAPEPPFGDRVRLVLGTEPPLVAEVTRSAVAALGLRTGAIIYAAFKATGVTSYR